MEYRIKEVHYKNGEVRYYPQKKRFLFWTNIEVITNGPCYSQFIDNAERAIEHEKLMDGFKVINTSYKYY